MSGEKVMGSAGARPDTDRVYAAATEWMVRLRHPKVTAEDILAWQAWMQQSSVHITAFRRMEEVNELLRSLPHPHLPAREVTAGWYDGSMPIRLWKRNVIRSKPGWAIAASVIFATVTVWLIGTASIPRWGASQSAMVVQTRIGENRLVRLADGSTVTLGGNSKVSVTFQKSERDLDLLRGEAFFTVAKNPQRPFKVSAARAMVIAVGTEFDVRRDVNQVTVNVIEGRVIVLPRSSIVPVVILRAFRPNLEPVLVSAGEQTTVNSLEVRPPSTNPDPSDATSWRLGRLAFRMQPLGEVLQQVNRYSRKRIVLTDPDVAKLKVTGTVLAANVAGWVHSLHDALGIVATDEPDRIVLRRPQH